MRIPRVRFAPAPTGFLHVGGARTALFNWLFARRHEGQFILRVEDTDEAKKSPEFVDAILEPLRWLGLDWDEGPYFQSQRKALYDEAIARLLASGQAYFCDLDADEVKRLSADAGLREGYHGWSRDRGVSDGEGVVVRFRVPDEVLAERSVEGSDGGSDKRSVEEPAEGLSQGSGGMSNKRSVVINDRIRGKVVVPYADISDFVIRRGDGSATFFLANAVDDFDMGITHVIRGEDLLNTAPKVRLLWDALGYGEPPEYAHLPLLVNAQRKKLSKRRESVALSEFVEAGYLSEAMLNYLALLGWGPPDGKEIRPIGELAALFSLDAVGKGGAFFDQTKLNNINQTYMKALSPSEFAEVAKPWFGETYDLAVVEALAPEVQQRITTLSEVDGWLSWLFVDEIEQFDEKAWAKAMVGGRAAKRVLVELTDALGTCSFEDASELEAATFSVGTKLTEELGVRVRSQAPLRIALTGSGSGIPLWQAMTFLGKEKTLARIAAALSKLENDKPPKGANE